MNSTAREAEDQPPEHENRPRRPEGPSWRWQNCAGALCTTHGRRRDAEASCLLRRATSRRVHEARFVIGLHNLLCTNNDAQLPASPPVPPSRSCRSSHATTAPSIPSMHAVSSTTDATPAPTPSASQVTPLKCLTPTPRARCVGRYERAAAPHMRVGPRGCALSRVQRPPQCARHGAAGRWRGCDVGLT